MLIDKSCITGKIVVLQPASQRYTHTYPLHMCTHLWDSVARLCCDRQLALSFVHFLLPSRISITFYTMYYSPGASKKNSSKWENWKISISHIKLCLRIHFSDLSAEALGIATTTVRIEVYEVEYSTFSCATWGSSAIFTFGISILCWSVLVCSGCYNKNTGGLKNKYLFLSFGGWEVQNQGASSERALWGLFYKNTISIHEGSTLMS